MLQLASYVVGYVLFTRMNWSVVSEKEEGRKKIKKDTRKDRKKPNCKELRKELITRHTDRAVYPIGQILNDGELFNLI